MRLRRALLFGVSLLTVRGLPAQRHPDLERADALLSAGRILQAEQVYYEAARRRPRDPETRRALGRYLAARGALRVGAVLLEEARFFGGDRQAVASDLAPVYAALGDYRALAALPATPLAAAERRRAEWLANNLPEVVLSDSSVLGLAPPGADGIGEISIVIGGDTITATVDPGTAGLVLDTAWARRSASRIFGSRTDARRASGVIAEVNVGAAVLRRVPARYTPMPPRRARLGLDILASLTPTMDERQRRLVIRAPRARVRVAGERLLTLTTRGTLLVATPDTAVSIDSRVARAWLAGRRWTWLARAGEIRVEQAR